MFVFCRNCDWSQDDFWSWRYNPIRYLMDYGVRRVIKKFRNQKWWTFKSWAKAVVEAGEQWPECPKCGMRKLGVD